MACTTGGGLAIRNSPYESLFPRREKEAKPSSDNNHAYKPYRHFYFRFILENGPYGGLDSLFPERCSSEREIRW